MGAADASGADAEAEADSDDAPAELAEAVGVGVTSAVAEGRRVDSGMRVALDMGESLLPAVTEGDDEGSSSWTPSSEAATQRSAS
jgi:hypothetical protein